MQRVIASIAALAIAVHLAFRGPVGDWPLIAALVAGGIPLTIDIAKRILRREMTADLLAGLSIVTAALMQEYLAGTLVVLMLSGGKALEEHALRSASTVLEALAKRTPTKAHRRQGESMVDVALADVAIGDALVILPHEICPVDGVVVEGHGSMDESYLTGEPYHMAKAPGVQVLSGAMNGEAALVIRAEKLAVDSRYAKIMGVMRDSVQQRPRMRRMADQLGAIYTPIALLIAAGAWAYTGEAMRFLAVLVVATPCPLLIGIPVTVMGSVSLAARRGIIIKDPSVLERIRTCTVALFDKTGTLTYGRPKVSAVIPAEGFDEEELLALVASLERYSRHPLSNAVVAEAEHRSIVPVEASEVREKPGAGLVGVVEGRQVQVTGRKKLLAQDASLEALLPPLAGGMECLVVVDGRYAGAVHFRDEPREEGAPFIKHLARHGFERLLLVSGDRQAEVQYLADRVGIKEVHYSQTPEQKLALVRAETARAPTVFLGDGINDAPALTAATVGIAFGQASDITSEAASAVILDSSLQRVDELMHIGDRMRTIALQSAVGGMALSVVGMGFAAAGALPPVAGAVAQEVIDVLAVMNALRAAMAPKELSDY